MIDCKKAIAEGICKADCCGVVTFPKETVAKNIGKMQCAYEEYKVEGNRVAITTRDLRCVFMTKDHSCAIYDDRPDVCKNFGSGKDYDGKEELLMYCPHMKPNGNMWSPAKKKQLQRLISHKIDERMKEWS